MKGLTTRNLHVKYESPATYFSRDIAKDKVLSTGNDDYDDNNDAEGIKIALRTIFSVS